MVHFLKIIKFGVIISVDVFLVPGVMSCVGKGGLWLPTASYRGLFLLPSSSGNSWKQME